MSSDISEEKMSNKLIISTAPFFRLKSQKRGGHSLIKFKKKAFWKKTNQVYDSGMCPINIGGN